MRAKSDFGRDGLHFDKSIGTNARLPKPDGNVARRAERWIECVIGALEDELDGATRRDAGETSRGHVADFTTVEADHTVARIDQSGHKPRERRFA